MLESQVVHWVRRGASLAALTSTLAASGVAEVNAQPYYDGPPSGSYYSGYYPPPGPYVIYRGPSWGRGGYGSYADQQPGPGYYGSYGPPPPPPPPPGYRAMPYSAAPYGSANRSSSASSTDGLPYRGAPYSAYGPYGAPPPSSPRVDARSSQPRGSQSDAVDEAPGPQYGSGPKPVLTAPLELKSMELPVRLSQAARAYLTYMARASEIDPHFAAGSDVAKRLKTGVAYEPRQFEEGAIAYVAMLALQDPGFVNGVRAALVGGRGDGLASGLIADPTSVLRLNGAQLAAARAAGALIRQGDKLMLAGLSVKQSAYDVQRSSWSKAGVVEPQSRLAGVKSLSTSRGSPTRLESDPLLRRALAEAGAPASGVMSGLVSRGLALAALTVMGRAGEVEEASALFVEEKSGECLKMAKLNLFQCLAVAGPHYEDIFCLGQHAMMDTAQCVISGSGVSQPLLSASAARRPEATRSISAAPRGYWGEWRAASTTAEGASR